MNPLSLHHNDAKLSLRLLRALRRRPVGSVTLTQSVDAHLSLARRINDPLSTARIARELLRYWREDVTLGLSLDDRHHFVGHCVADLGRGPS